MSKVTALKAPVAATVETVIKPPRLKTLLYHIQGTAPYMHRAGGACFTAELGMAWQGMAGVARRGVAGLGLAGPGKAWQAWRGGAWRGVAGHGMAGMTERTIQG